LASRLQKRPAVRVLKGGRARLSAHAHLQLAAFAGRLVGNQNSYQQEVIFPTEDDIGVPIVSTIDVRFVYSL